MTRFTNINVAVMGGVIRALWPVKRLEEGLLHILLLYIYSSSCEVDVEILQ